MSGIYKYILVGQLGGIRKWSGFNWSTKEVSGLTKNLYTVFGYDHTQIWIGGADGTILLSTDDGDNWEQKTGPDPGHSLAYTDYDIVGIYGWAKNNILFVAARGSTDLQIWKWNGTEFSVFYDGYGNAETAKGPIWGPNENCVYVALSDADDDLLYYNGSTWTHDPSYPPSTTPRVSSGIHGIDADNVFLLQIQDWGGSNRMIWEGELSSWSDSLTGVSSNAARSTDIANGLWFDADSQVGFAWFSDEASPDHGVIYKYENGSWSLAHTTTLVLSAANVFGCKGINKDDVIFCASSSQFVRYTGGSYQEGTVPGSTINLHDTWGWSTPVEDHSIDRITSSKEYTLEITDEGKIGMTDDGLEFNRDFSIKSRAKFLLRVRHGEWWGDPELGSKFHLIKTLRDAETNLESYAKEALEPLMDEGVVTDVIVRDLQTDHRYGSVYARIVIEEPEGSKLDLGFFKMGS